MSTVVKDLGAVSAYAYAVEKGYTGTEAEFAELMADYAEVGQRAEDAAESASASATASAQSASQASASEQGCERAVLDATSAAAIARARADEASGYAQTASTKASEAVGCVETATQKATEATQSASQALGYKNDAESAKTASQTAQGLAESARDSAISAKNDAESARDDAQEIVDGISAKAEQIDTNTADITELESTKADLSELYKAFPTDTASGAIASFSDGADGIPLKSLVVDINPVQDLHGYDSPWPAGGGKNLFRTTASSKTQNGVTWTVNDDGSVTVSGTAEDYTDLAPFGSAKVDSSMETVTIKIDGISLQSNIACGPIVLYDASNASIYMVTNGGATITTYTVDLSQYPTVDHIDVALKRNNTGAVTNGTVKVQIEKGSTATAWTPYENICPISGWTEVDVEQSGVNVWDEEWEKGGISNGRPVSSTNQMRSKNYCAILPNTTYYGTCGKTDGGNQNKYYLTVAFYDVEKTWISNVAANNLTFTTPSNAAFFKIYTNNSTVVYGNVYNHDISINYPSTVQDYHPYSGQSVTINLGQTVYGGKLDVLSGVLTVDRAVVDLGTLVWTVASGASSPSGKLFQTVSNIAKPRERYTPNNVICTIYKTADQNVWFTGDYLDLTVGVGNTGKIIVRDDRYDNDTTAFKSAVSGVQLVYELAEPIEIQLSASQINSIYGVNNLWADSGDTEVAYRADTKLYIERLTAPDSVDMIADANITSGQYFMVGNSLYKATANIANGSAIVVGTNCIRKSLSEALNEINA